MSKLNIIPEEDSNKGDSSSVGNDGPTPRSSTNNRKYSKSKSE